LEENLTALSGFIVSIILDEPLLSNKKKSCCVEKPDTWGIWNRLPPFSTCKSQQIA